MPLEGAWRGTHTHTHTDRHTDRQLKLFWGKEKTHTNLIQLLTKVKEVWYWDNMYVVEKIETYRNSCGANNDVLFFISGLPLQSGGNNL